VSDPKHKDISIRVAYRFYLQILRLVETGFYGTTHTAVTAAIVQNAITEMVLSGQIDKLIQSAKDAAYDASKAGHEEERPAQESRA